ncbi:FkbM family methyltransferase [Mucilaginibacter sp. BJC16-A38]|uniref:FkbM family methyltransferase n=1 Tax=Mucilaginibacter phenanthrenivorans TaxID=1234842 RepID=UPI002157B337|nr:FkbM family methyltransferase [Mucilaginibacter phenanthrenivorans]MCR8560845.1 FkbM family methyltransferase [Mucilaginibacter phenanthrenivorans]
METFKLNFKGKFTTGSAFSGSGYSTDQGNLICRSLLQSREDSNGAWVDIGTHHRYPFSDTVHFFQKGWRRIVIEAASGSANLLKLIPGQELAGLSAEREQERIIKLLSAFNKAKPGNNLDPASQQKTTSPSFAVNKTVNTRKTSIARVLEDCLPAGQTIDFLSLDADGFNLRALKAINWSKHAPLFVIVKSEAGMKRMSGSVIYNLLKKKRYEPVFKTPNICFFKLTEN